MPYIYSEKQDVGKEIAFASIYSMQRITKNPSKPFAQHFNLPSHSADHVTICGIYLH